MPLQAPDNASKFFFFYCIKTDSKGVFVFILFNELCTPATCLSKTAHRLISAIPEVYAVVLKISLLQMVQYFFSMGCAAAVVNPLICVCFSNTIVPAPIKPIPLITCANSGLDPGAYCHSLLHQQSQKPTP